MPIDLEDQLEDERRRVSRDGAFVVKTLDGEPFVLQGSGGSGFRWRLVGETGAILLGKMRRGAGAPGVKIEVGSFGCWYHGPATAYLHMRRAVNELLASRRCRDCGTAIGKHDRVCPYVSVEGSRACGSTDFEYSPQPDGWEARPTRLDLCVDFQGPPMTPDMPLTCTARAGVFRAWDEPDGKCPACGYGLGPTYALPLCGVCGWALAADSWKGGIDKTRRAPMPSSIALGGEVYHRRRKFTGWAWGKGLPAMLRIYDKTLEIAQNSPDKVWFPVIWKQAKARGLDEYDPSRTVMRCELELHGRVLRKVKVGGFRLRTVEDVMAHSDALKVYFMGHHKRRCVDCNEFPADPRAQWCAVCPEKYSVGTDGKRKRVGARVRRPRGWLELKDRPLGLSDTRVSRLPLHPLWQRLQDCRFDFALPCSTGIRRVRDKARAEIVKPLAFGCLETAAAVDEGLQITGGNAQERWVEFIRRLQTEFPSEMFWANVDAKRRLVYDAPAPANTDGRRLVDFDWKEDSGGGARASAAAAGMADGFKLRRALEVDLLRRARAGDANAEDALYQLNLERKRTVDEHMRQFRERRALVEGPPK